MVAPQTDINEKDAAHTEPFPDAFNCDVIFTKLGKFGRLQRKFWMCMAFTIIFPASAILVYTFTGNVPQYRCFIDGLDDDTTPVYGESWLTNLTALNPVNANKTVNQCWRYDVTWTNDSGIVFSLPGDNTTVTCNRWIFDDSVFTSTVATDFVLTCDNEWKNTFVGSLTMIGLMVGSLFLGPLADILGRRMAYLILSIWMAGFSIGSSFAPNYETFAALRFLTGMGGMALIQTNFIWGVEFMAPVVRIKYIFTLNLCQALGNLLTGMVAYFIRDWRYVHLIIFCPMAILISYYFFLPESPRWLISRKRYEEAKRILEDGAKLNGKTLDPRLLEIPDQRTTSKGEIIPPSGADNETILDVLKTPCLIKRLLILFLAWASAMLCYYGLAYSSTNLAGDIFLNYILVILVEIPACLTGMFVVEWLGRRPIVNVTLMAGGVFCLAAGLIPQDVTAAVIACSLIGKYFIAMQTVTINMMTSELFPTNVRGICIGLCSTFGKFGGILAPIIATIGKTSPELPYVIFGILNICVGVLSLLLPETKGIPMPSNIAEAKALEKNLISLRCKKKKGSVDF